MMESGLNSVEEGQIVERDGVGVVELANLLRLVAVGEGNEKVACGRKRPTGAIEEAQGEGAHSWRDLRSRRLARAVCSLVAEALALISARRLVQQIEPQPAASAIVLRQQADPVPVSRRSGTQADKDSRQSRPEDTNLSPQCATTAHRCSRSPYPSCLWQRQGLCPAGWPRRPPSAPRPG